MPPANTTHEQEIARLGYVQQDGIPAVSGDTRYWHHHLEEGAYPAVRVEIDAELTSIYVFDGQLFDYRIEFDRRVPGHVVGRSLAAVAYVRALTALDEAVKVSA